MKFECESRCFNYPLECSKCKATSDIYNHNPCFLDRNSDLVKRIKSEAIKEFAERLKKITDKEGWTDSCEIDDLVKEMVGDGR